MSGPVLLTGAAGRIGTVLRGGLPERGWAVRCLDVVPVTDVRPGEEHVVADVTDLAAMASSAVDMPTRSAPMVRSIRISAGVS